MEKVLLLGLHPDVVDFSAFPGLTKEKLAASLAAQERVLRELGFDVNWCLIDRGETAEDVVLAELRAHTFDAVLIGAGIRAVPQLFLLFERLINLVHAHAPTANICFNTNPEDTREAVLRWTREKRSRT